MRKIFYCFYFFLLFLLITTVNVSADVYTVDDLVTFGENGILGDADSELLGIGKGSVNKLEGAGDYLHYEHNYEFTPAAASIIDATLIISTRDDEDLFCKTEIGFVWAEDGFKGMGEVDTNDYGFNVDINSVLDGNYTVFIGDIWGDFFVDSSELIINYTADVSQAPVPEPATLLLLGSGLIGFAGARRKKTK